MIAKVGVAARASKWPAAALILSGIMRMVFVMLLALRDLASIFEPTLSNLLSARDRGQRRPTTATYSFLEGRPS